MGSRTKAEIEAENKRLKQENAIFREASEIDSKTIADLKARQADPAIMERLNTLADFGRWRIIRDDDSEKPNPGQIITVVYISLSELIEQIAHGDRRLSAAITFRTMQHYDPNFDSGDLGPGFIPAAWLPVSEPEWSIVAGVGTGQLKQRVTADGFSTMSERANRKGGPQLEKHVLQILNKVKQVFEKLDYTGGTRQGKNIILMGHRVDK